MLSVGWLVGGVGGGGVGGGGGGGGIGGVHISNHSRYMAGLIELLLFVNIINNNKTPCLQ